MTPQTIPVLSPSPVDIDVAPVPYGAAARPSEPSPALKALLLALAQSKRSGHTACVAHACGVWPA